MKEGPRVLLGVLVVVVLAIVLYGPAMNVQFSPTLSVGGGPLNSITKYDASSLMDKELEARPRPGDIVGWAEACRPNSWTCDGDDRVYYNSSCNEIERIACGENEVCSGGECVCVPATCESLGNYGCNSWDDGCGGTLDCGACSGGEECVNGLCEQSIQEECGMIITEDTTFTEDIIDCTGTYIIRIQGNDITLDCNGHTLSRNFDSSPSENVGVEFLSGSANNVLKNCVIKNNSIGVKSSYVSGLNGKNIIQNNQLEGNLLGVKAYQAVVENNTISFIGPPYVSFQGSSNVGINGAESVLRGNIIYGGWILLEDSLGNNLVEDNSLTGPAIAGSEVIIYTSRIYVSSNNNIIHRNNLIQPVGYLNGFGIVLASSSNNLIEDNIIENFNYGLYLVRYSNFNPLVSNNSIKRNIFRNTNEAVTLQNGYGLNYYQNNVFINNNKGLKVYCLNSSSINVVLGNVFINNNLDAISSSCPNVWNTSTSGNLWDDYSGSGSYQINANNTDWHPSTAIASCGNGLVDNGEQCEIGQDESCIDSSDYRGVKSCYGCLGWDVCVPMEHCGDGTINGNEACETDDQCSGSESCAGCSCVRSCAPGDSQNPDGTCTATYLAQNYDVLLYKQGGWDSIRSSSTGTIASQTQYLINGRYNWGSSLISRIIVPFNMSVVSLPQGAQLISAKFKIRTSAYPSGSEPSDYLERSIALMKVNMVSPPTVVSGDYNLSRFTQELAPRLSSEQPRNTWMNFNIYDPSIVEEDGWVGFGLLTGPDISNNILDGNTYIQVGGSMFDSSTAGSGPRLEVTYLP